MSDMLIVVICLAVLWGMRHVRISGRRAWDQALADERREITDRYLTEMHRRGRLITVLRAQLDEAYEEGMAEMRARFVRRSIDDATPEQIERLLDNANAEVHVRVWPIFNTGSN